MIDNTVRNPAMNTKIGTRLRCGMFRLDRIQGVGEKLCTCGDYLHGFAQTLSTHPECGHDWFRPCTCKGFYLWASCGRTRTRLITEYSTKEPGIDGSQARPILPGLAMMSRYKTVADTHALTVARNQRGSESPEASPR